MRHRLEPPQPFFTPQIPRASRACDYDRRPREYRPPPFVQQHSDHFMDQVAIPEMDLADPDRYYASCWTWTGKVYRGKDIVFRPQGAWVPIHRFAYELHIGVVPEGFTARTECADRICVTPRHLVLRPRNQNAAAVSAEARAIIRSLVHDHGHAHAELARRFGLSAMTIGRIARERDA